MSNMSFKIDNREHKLINLFENSKQSISYEVETLVHGDIQLIHEQQPLFIIERKSIDDLVASIKDGRYKNQKAILFQSGYSSTQIYYIIEGNLKKWADNTEMIKGAIINMLLRDKIGLFFTKTIEDTYDLLTNIYTRVNKDPSSYTTPSSSKMQIVTLSQNDKITPPICFHNMLCQIPGISDKSADALCIEFGTLKQLFFELDSLSESDIQKRFSSIKVNGRKISSKIITNLMSYLLT